MPCDLIDIEQTLFLGCTIESFSCNLGWNEDVSTLTVDLVEDPCAGDKVYYDVYSHPDIKKTFTLADPGFMIYGPSQNQAPEIGAPCYFRFGNFEFSGLLQSWKKTSYNTTVNTYQVILASPSELLNGTQLILGEYAGSTDVYNAFNVYAAAEELFSNDLGQFANFTQNNNDGVLFGTLPNGYGGANLTDAGMPWSIIKSTVSYLTSSIPSVPSGGPSPLNPLLFNRIGRVCFVGTGTTIPKYGMLARDGETPNLTGSAAGPAAYLTHYLLDLNDIPISPADIRIPGPTANLLTVISQVCQALSCDYFIELLPTYVNGIVRKIIKVRIVSRVFQTPNLGQIESFISSQASTGRVVNAEYGRELRNESSYRVLVGGNKRSIYQIANYVPSASEDPDRNALIEQFGANNEWARRTITNYFGTDSSGNVYIPVDDGTIPPYLNIDMTELKPHLSYIGGFVPNTLQVPLTVIFASTNYQQFLDTLVWDKKSSLYKLLERILPSVVGRNLKQVTLGKKLGALGRDAYRTFQNAESGAAKDMQKIFAMIQDIRNIASSSFMVRIPFVAAKKDTTTGIITTSDVPTEGGWTEAANLLGIPIGSGIVDHFRNSDGTIPAIITNEIPEGFDLALQNLDGVKHFWYSNPQGIPLPGGGSATKLLYLQTSVQPDIKFVDALTAFSPRVVVDYTNPFSAFIESLEEEYLRLNALQNEAKRFNGIQDNEPEAPAFPFTTRPLPGLAPSIAIPFESREVTYGPWYPTNAIQVGATQVDVVKNDSLVPWNYGSLASLNSVANLEAGAGIGGVLEGETGSITMVGIPSVPLGSELNSVGTGATYDGNIHLFENRTAAVINFMANSIPKTYYSIVYGVFDGSGGPNCNSISINFGIDGVNTTYTFRTFSPIFGSLSKYRADKLGKQIKFANTMAAKQRLLQTKLAVQQKNTQNMIAAARYVDNREINHD